MRRLVERIGSAVLEILLPSARAEACGLRYCEQKGSQHRCCQICPGGKVCGSYVSGGCSGVIC